MCGPHESCQQVITKPTLVKLYLCMKQNNRSSHYFRSSYIKGSSCPFAHFKSEKTLFLHLIAERCVLFRARGLSPAAFFFFNPAFSTVSFRQQVCRNIPNDAKLDQFPYTTVSTRGLITVIHWDEAPKTIFHILAVEGRLNCIPPLLNCIPMASGNLQDGKADWHGKDDGRIEDERSSCKQSAVPAVSFEVCLRTHTAVSFGEPAFCVTLSFTLRFWSHHMGGSELTSSRLRTVSA